MLFVLLVKEKKHCLKKLKTNRTALNIKPFSESFDEYFDAPGMF